LLPYGIKELIVIAQDTTKYGIDLYGKPCLAELLDKLCKIQGFKWIRFLYAYPESITDELINVVKRNDKICKYFDIPLQHFSDQVLKRMNRKSDSKSIECTIDKIRKEASKYHEDDIKDYLITLSKLDVNIKSGKYEKNTAFQSFLVNLLEY